MAAMSEHAAAPEHATLADILADGQFHPVMSGFQLTKDQPATFWISELAEKPLHLEDHGEAQCYRVDLQPLPGRWAREGDDVSFIGTTEVTGTDEIQLLTINGLGYAYNRTLAGRRRAAKDPTQ